MKKSRMNVKFDIIVYSLLYIACHEQKHLNAILLALDFDRFIYR